MIQFVTLKESHDDWNDKGNSLHWHDKNAMKTDHTCKNHLPKQFTLLMKVSVDFKKRAP